MASKFDWTYELPMKLIEYPSKGIRHVLNNNFVPQLKNLIDIRRLLPGEPMSVVLVISESINDTIVAHINELSSLNVPIQIILDDCV